MERQRRQHAGAKMESFLTALKQEDSDGLGEDFLPSATVVGGSNNNNTTTTPCPPRGKDAGLPSPSSSGARPKEIQQSRGGLQQRPMAESVAALEDECRQLELDLRRLKLQRRREHLLCEIDRESSVGAVAANNSTEFPGPAVRPTSQTSSPPNDQGVAPSAGDPVSTPGGGGSAELEATVLRLKGKVWAESTKRTYASQMKCFFNFCDIYNINPFPITTHHLALYVAFLVDVRHFQYRTIKSYMAIISQIHLAMGCDDPLQNNWELRLLLQGVKRELGDAQNGAPLVTPSMLLKIKPLLHEDSVCDVSIWCACLLGFFGLLRPGNFLRQGKFVSTRDLCLSDVSRCEQGYLVSLKRSKTLQFREKTLSVVLPDLQGHPLCPVSAFEKLITLLPVIPSSPLLLGSDGDALSYGEFLGTVRSKLESTGDTTRVTGHSFRRAGATWAFSVGLPGEVIQDIGFWKSNAYLRYLVISTRTKFDQMSVFGGALPKE